MLQADPSTAEHIGIIPGCVALGACDIGRAKINGATVYTTWGLNLTAERQAWFEQKTTFRPIQLTGTAVELVLPPEVAETLLTIAIRKEEA